MKTEDKNKIEAIDRINNAGIRIYEIYLQQLNEAMHEGDMQKVEYIVHKLDNINKMRITRLYDKKQIVIDNACRQIDNEISAVTKQICRNLLKK